MCTKEVFFEPELFRHPAEPWEILITGIYGLLEKCSPGNHYEDWVSLYKRLRKSAKATLRYRKCTAGSES